MRCRCAAIWALLACLIAAAPRARAQSDDASISSLRDRLAELEAARPPGVPAGALTSIGYVIDVAERIERNFEEPSVAWRARAARYLAIASEGRDPFQELGGRIFQRAYDSPISTVRQGYAIYLPPNYDPSRAYPLLVMLHGGSSNGNLFLGVVLGNNMDWETYDEHLWDEYTPRWSPDWIVVAPDGFGQVLWRWMGEEDVLSVIDDVQRHYHVDADRVVLGGLSNGGLGAYAIGMRHAWRFSRVMAIAGAPSWVQYAGGNPTPEERTALLTHSAMHLVHNSLDTDFRFYHGLRDPGPMRPAYVQQMEEHMRGIGLTPQVQWFDFGHDLLYLVHRHGRVYPEMARSVRDRRPAQVHLVTGDYRAARQHWVGVTRIDEYPRLASLVARASEGAIEVTTERVLELWLDLRDAPVGEGDRMRVSVDGVVVHDGPRASLGHVIHVARGDGTMAGTWRLGFLPAVDGLEKVPGLSGPLTDPYRDGMIHVYGTADPEQTEALRATAERGSRGWPLWLWNHQQRVVADTDVTDEMMRAHHLVLYGTPGSNTLLERMWEHLPVRVDANGVRVGERSFGGADVGVRFVYPNPLSPTRYVIVQAAPSIEGVRRGHNLPDFLPDWVVYDARTARTRPRLIQGRSGSLAMGYFDRFWRVPTITADASGLIEDPARGSLAALAGPVIGGDDGPPTDVPVMLAQLDGGPVDAGRAMDAGRIEARATDAGRDAGHDAGHDSGHDAGHDGGHDAEAGVASAMLDGGALDGAIETPEQRARRIELNRILGAPEDFVIPTAVLTQTPPPELPPGEVPETPRRPRRFLAPDTDPAGHIARVIARRVPTFLNYRAIIPGGRWVVDRNAVWRVRAEADCVGSLAALGVPAHAVPPLETPVPSPVQLDGAVDGVTFVQVPAHEGEPFLLSCEMAARLPALTRVLRAHDVVRVEVLSAYRTAPRQSFHTLGLALDMSAFDTSDGERLSVLEDFVETPAHATCEAPRPRGAHARALLRIACELVATRAFSSVLTPNYNDGHRDHFHVDARPDDPRVFVR